MTGFSRGSKSAGIPASKRRGNGCLEELGLISLNRYHLPWALLRKRCRHPVRYGLAYGIILIVVRIAREFRVRKHSSQDVTDNVRAKESQSDAVPLSNRFDEVATGFVQNDPYRRSKIFIELETTYEKKPWRARNFRRSFSKILCLHSETATSLFELAGHRILPQPGTGSGW